MGGDNSPTDPTTIDPSTSVQRDIQVAGWEKSRPIF